MLALKDWLPDLKGALNSVYEEQIKGTLETKSTEYKELLQTHLTEWNKKFQTTQNALIVIALAIFFLLLIAYFWK